MTRDYTSELTNLYRQRSQLDKARAKASKDGDKESYLKYEMQSNELQITISRLEREIEDLEI